MATDYAEKERAFVTGLMEDTGRDLAGWMEAISGSGLSDRNAVIDWLRRNGFTFARASWLQRIHHNGGKLIYADEIAALERAEASELAARAAPAAQVEVRLQKAVPDTLPPPAVLPAETPRPAGAPQLRLVAAPAPAQSTQSTSAPATSSRAMPAPALPESIQELLAAAKGLRPLAQLTLGEIARSMPHVRMSASPPLVILSGDKPFAALLPGPKELRLYGHFDTAGGFAKRTEAAMRASVPFPQVVVLNDARQINAILIAHIRAALEASQL